MNINGIGGSSATTAIAPNDLQGSQRPSSIPPAGSGPAATTTISTPGELFSKLQQLQEKDPAQFKQVMSSLASDLRSEAAKTDGPQSAFMTKLADRFDQAAQSGNLSAAKPDEAQGAQGAHKHHGHGHHHHGGGGIGDMAGVLQNALDKVNQALAAPAAADGSSPTTAPQS